MSDAKFEPIFDPAAPDLEPRQKEWVSLSKGRLCVWELDANDLFFIAERCARPGSPIHSRSDEQLWKVLVSCYRGEEEGSARVFDVTQLGEIGRLKFRDLAKILGAIDRVNGTAPEEVAEAERFTAAPKDTPLPSSTGGVSSTSAACAPRSGSPPRP